MIWNFGTVVGNKSELILNRPSRPKFFSRGRKFLQNLDSNKWVSTLNQKMCVKIKLRIITKTLQSIYQFSLPKNPFYGLGSSERPLASVGVKMLVEFEMKL